MLLFARADPRGQQARMPSRWLLDGATHLEGRLLATDDLEVLGRRDWFTVVASYQAGLSAPLPLPGVREFVDKRRKLMSVLSACVMDSCW